MNNLTVETNETFASLLELAANNDVEGFKQLIDHNSSGINEVGLWYSRHKGSKQMVLLYRTPLMVASTYGSIDIVKLIISFSNTDINKACGTDNSTALHCAASGGSVNATDVVKVLLEAGADPNLVDSNGCRPVDVIVFPPKLENSKKSSLEELLSTDFSSKNSGLSPENGSPSSNFSPDRFKIDDIRHVSARKEYPIDPSLPDIKNGYYSTDEFRIFFFKVRPCSRAYSHDWTECPFVHPGENARRRDPRKYHYSCVPCPEFRKGNCRKGDMCEYAHGVFESWLHPAQYRTRMCKDGASCNRRVCFFAHAQDELRPLYSSPRSAPTNAIDFANMSLFPNSPSSPFASSLSPTPLSPSGNACWPPQNVPALHLPGSNYNHSGSRLKSAINARDFQADHILAPSNLEDIFSSEPVFSPIHKRVLSPINTNFSPRSVDRAFAHSPFAGPSSGPLLRENFRSLSSRDMGTRGPSWVTVGSASGQADWTVKDEEFGKLRRSSSFEIKNNDDDEEEPDFGWVHSLVKEDNNQIMDGVGSSGEGEGEGEDHLTNSIDAMIGAWMEQMTFDEEVVA